MNNRFLLSSLILFWGGNLFAQNAFTARSQKDSSGKKATFAYSETRYGGSQNQINQIFVKPDSKYLIQFDNNQTVIQVSGKTENHAKAQIPSQSAMQFITSISNDLGIAASDKFTAVYSNVDELAISHTKVNRLINNIPVFCGEIIVHQYTDGNITAQGMLLPTPNENPAALVSAEIAIHSAESLVVENEHIAANSELWQFSAGKETVANLYYVNINGVLQKVFVVDYFPNHIHWWRVWVDAYSGKVLNAYEKTCSIDGPRTATATDLNGKSQTINTYQVGATYMLIDATKPMFNSGRGSIPNDPYGAIWTIDAKNTNGSSLSQITSSSNTWTDKSAVSAHYHAGLVYDYYKSVHNRNSINGNGGTMISVVNVTENGAGLDNAYWNGQAMFYGNGKTAFKPLAGSLDVAGHEITHGVISSTANLEYQGQSGAINESMADVFGVLIDRDDWRLGEDVVKTSVFPSGALRDVSNPHNGRTSLGQNGYQPMKMSEAYKGTDDNGGVHINSGIPNHAFYLIANTVGKNDAEKIYYRALTNYLTSSSNFLALRYAIVQAATDLFGANSTHVAKAKEAFDTVEIFDPNAGSTGGGTGSEEKDLPKNTGTENILSIDIDPFNSNTLYRSSTAGDNFKAFSQTDFLRKPSVLDDGSVCVFVADDNNIHSVDLKGTNGESVLTSDAFWSNVAVSRDGKRLAGVSTEIDSAIYVYDFTTKKWNKFTLYNPTFSGVSAGGVLYADAIEFDYSGEYILYDSRNLINSTSGTLDYWDIGIIRVWDNQSNNWGNGKVEKLFSQLPSDVSIGNPTYSKNSPYIIAFDYIDEFADDYALLALNTSSGKVSTVFDNVKLSFPNYSNDDAKIIFDAQSSGNDVIGIISMKTDKITPSGSASLLINDAKWGVWYANGTRSLFSSEKDLLSFAFPAVQGASKAVFSGTNINVTVPDSVDVKSLIPTFTHSPKSTVLVATEEQISGANAKNFTTTVVYTVKAEDGSTKNYNVIVTKEIVNIDDILSQNILVYPNPANEVLFVSGVNPFSKFDLIDTKGCMVKSGNMNKSQISLTDVSAGTYFLIIPQPQGLIRKLILIE
ncbi:MAG: M4 family metallopeptidase [Flavobacteriales bacterium]|nr:M4 family metallopeptidase [Flavobacteriales bacterium]